MYQEKYSSETTFPYANGYYAIFPKGLEKNRTIGAGSIVVEDDYIIYFKPETPDDIKERFIREYAKHHKQQIETGLYKN